MQLSGNRFHGYTSTCNKAITNLAQTGRGRKQIVGMAVDYSLATVSLWAAYSLRLGQPFSDFRSTWSLFLVLAIGTVVGFASLGVYRWVIRSTNLRLFKQLFKGCLVSMVLLETCVLLMPPDRINPRSLIVIYALLLVVSTVGIRVIWKWLFDVGRRGEPIAIFGAGAAGQKLVNLLSTDSKYHMVSFIDDDETLVNTTLFGLPIIGGSDEQLRARLKREDVSKVILAIPSLSSAEYHRKIQQLNRLGMKVLTMPSVEKLIDGTARAEEIRDVSIVDILGRSEVAANIDLMGRRVTGKTVLVTGGGGSIGSELCRQVMKLSPKQLIVVDNCEANLYHISEELVANVSNDHTDATGSVETVIPTFKPQLLSVLDRPRIQNMLANNTIDTVFHAAAYKHVPIVEAQPDQGVEVNVLGTKNMLELSIASGVADFVLISTDKAVRPTNAMGASKRVAELILQAHAARQSTTRISMVRFGNVLGSSGSVVPKFKRQIMEGGPLTLTHPDVTRYFMTIPEASQLVLQASAIATGGEVFVLDMGEPVLIRELAETMVRLYGKRLRQHSEDPQDIEIVIEGLRPGEKLYEELFITDTCQPTEVAKISAANEQWIDWDSLRLLLNELQLLAENQDYVGVRELLLALAFHDDKRLGLSGDGSLKRNVG